MLVSYCEQTGIPWVFLGRGQCFVDDAGFRGWRYVGPDFARIAVDGGLRLGPLLLWLRGGDRSRYSLSGLEFAGEPLLVWRRVSPALWGE